MTARFPLLAALFLMGNGSHAAPAIPQAEPTIDTAAIIMMAPDGYAGTCFDSSKFRVARPDTLFPARFSGGRTSGMVKLNAEDRTAYLQGYSAQFAASELYFFAILLCDGGRREITILSTQNDDNDLLWLRYDQENQLNGFDTLISSYGDGQRMTQEFAYWEPWGSFTIATTTHETYRDGNDTMAYLTDTLLYERRLVGIMYIPDEGGDPVERYELERVPLDLTRHWMTKYPTEEPAKEQRYSLRSVMPPRKHAFLTAIGDLNGDHVDDYVFALEDGTIPDPENNLRDLQIVFTTYSGFQQKLYLPAFFPGRSSGGFFDPIGEECCSGIFISGDTLIVALFGGSAWQWQTRHYYRYSEAQGTFFLIKEESRSFHSPSVDTMDEELADLEQLVTGGGKLDSEQQQRLTELRKMVADYQWTVVTHPIGELPIQVDK
ncbi:MAG: hypothetical protein ABIQ75_07715 [Flavobacteriales bacterium]